MNDDTLVVLIIFGSVFGIVFVSMLFSLAQKWIGRKNSSYDEEKFDRLAKAFIKYKKDSEKRLQNLEAVISSGDETPKSLSKERPKLKETQLHNSIEIDEDEKKDEQKESGGNLRNMLKE